MTDDIVAANALKAFITRIEDINDDIADRQIDRKAVYDEAKSSGFDVATMKKVVARRKKGEDTIRQEQELVKLYEAAISGQMTLPLVSVKLTSGDGTVLFEGNDQEFAEAADRAISSSPEVSAMPPDWSRGASQHEGVGVQKRKATAA